jgi:methionine-rich copper-binding protein CopC
LKISGLYLGLAIAAALAMPRAAWAGQPQIDHADPQPGSEVRVSPSEIKIWFTEPLDPLCRCIEVDDSDGNKVDDEDTHADPSDPKELIVSIRDRIYDGQYTVKWDVTSTGAEQNHGSYKFTVNIQE